MSVQGTRQRQRLLEPWQWHALALSTLVKLLLAPTYHSTDFEVHRHWLATTHALPMSQWYFDETSQWTLDYPPFFAYFSWLLSIPARFFDPRIVDLHKGLDYAEWSCKLYMRSTVILTELVLAFALFALSRPARSESLRQYTLPPWMATALLLHPGLIIVDHIHFQYNGFLYGILLWSLWAAREQRPLVCAFLFSTLLNFKHIYVYIAPAFFVYLLRTYVLRLVNEQSNISRTTSGIGERLFTLGFITLLPFALSIGPLAASGLTSAAPAGPLGILKQMLSRLFPFSRGLNHAYWAANAWALYTFADRVLVKFLHATHLNAASHGAAAGTRGIIGDVEFAILPQITAGHCFLVTLLCSLIFMARLWTRPTYSSFVQSIALFGLTSFLWGFHVHEKAILLGVIPLTLLAMQSYALMRKTLILTVAGTVGLFPLLFQGREIPIKILYSALWLLATPFSSAFSIRFASRFPLQPSPTNVELLVHVAENIYLFGFIVLELLFEIGHPLWMSRGIIHLTGPSEIIASAGQSVADGAASVLDTSPQDALDAASSVVSTVMESASDAASSAMAAIASSTGGGSLTSNPTDTAPTNLEFLPLMLTSVYCALGVTWVWLNLGASFVRSASSNMSRQEKQVKEKADGQKL